jgi:hypothetical protein
MLLAAEPERQRAQHADSVNLPGEQVDAVLQRPSALALTSVLARASALALALGLTLALALALVTARPAPPG